VAVLSGPLSVGTVARLRSGGVAFVVVSSTFTNTTGVYYNPVTGLFQSMQAPTDGVIEATEEPRKR
jgi:hypothetical protein